MAIVLMSLFLLSISAGTSAIARRKSPRRMKHRKLIAKRQRLQLLAIRAVTSMAPYAAKHAAPVEVDVTCSTLFGTYYFKLVWGKVCNSWRVNRLKADKQRLSAKIACLSETISFLKTKIYPSKPRKWQRLRQAGASHHRKGRGAVHGAVFMNLPACSPLASRRSSPCRWVLTNCRLFCP